MKAETLDRGRLTVTNPIDDTHDTFNHLKDAGITEAQAEVFTQMFKGLSGQTMQVNENLLMVRDELRGEITDIHLKLKDIDHKIDSNHQKLDAKIDKIQVKLEADLASTNQEVKHTRETLSSAIDSTRETLSSAIDSTRETLSSAIDSTRESLLNQIAQAQNSMMRWNIGMFIGLAGLMIALIRPWE